VLELVPGWTAAHDICGEFARVCARAFQVMAADRKALIGDGGTAQRASHARFPAPHTHPSIDAPAAGEFYRRHEASWAARTSVVDRTRIGSRHNTSVPRSAYDYHQPGERRALIGSAPSFHSQSPRRRFNYTQPGEACRTAARAAP